MEQVILQVVVSMIFGWLQYVLWFAYMGSALLCAIWLLGKLLDKHWPL